MSIPDKSWQPPFVVLETSMGDITLEMYWKHAPNTCRNFAELARRGYYNGCKFHRIIRDFMIQGGDPTGTGRGGASIYGKHFADEIHEDLKHSGAGLISMANAGPNTNGSQFFISLAPTQWLDGKHAIFALGIKCYVCNSHIDSNCTTISESSAKHIRDCDKILRSDSIEPYTKCMWATTHLKAEGKYHPEETRITRDCSRVEEYPMDEKSCYYRSTSSVKSTTCFCESDACNPANNLQGAGSLLVLCGMVAIALTRVIGRV